MEYDRAAAGPVTVVTTGGELFKLAAAGRPGGVYQLPRALGPEDEPGVLKVAVRVKVRWSELSAPVR
jgi:hypothetical protein